jgi:hypothetical protein
LALGTWDLTYHLWRRGPVFCCTTESRHVGG